MEIGRAVGFNGVPWHRHDILWGCRRMPWHAVARRGSVVACRGSVLACRGLPWPLPWHATKTSNNVHPSGLTRTKSGANIDPKSTTVLPGTVLLYF